SKAAIAREAQSKIDVAVFAGDAAIAVIADKQALDNHLEFAMSPFHFTDLLAIFRDVHRIVLGAVADFVHDGFEYAAADFFDDVAVLVEDLDMRRLDLINSVEQLP